MVLAKEPPGPCADSLVWVARWWEQLCPPASLKSCGCHEKTCQESQTRTSTQAAFLPCLSPQEELAPLGLQDTGKMSA